MVDSPDEPGGDVGGWLHDEAARLDAAAPPITADEAMGRPVPDLPHSRFRRVGGMSMPPLPGADRRMPALAAAVVAAVLIGSLAGFAFGRASAPDKTQTASAGGDRAISTTIPRIPPPFGAETRSAATDGVAGDAGYYGPQLTHLGTRTTADGVTIRAYTAEYPVPPQTDPVEPTTTIVTEKCDPSGVCSSSGSAVSPPWTPPSSCNPSSELWLESSTDEAVGQWSTAAFGLTDELGATSWSVFGQREGAPFSVAGAQVGDQVTTVRATWPDGFVDTAEVVGSWAYVGHKSEQAPSLEAIAADGSVLESAEASEGLQLPPECLPPPPSLPPPGDEQPTDPDAARAAVSAAIADAFKDGSTVEVGEIVFTSPEEAAALITVTYDGKGGYTEIVYTRLGNGEWTLDYLGGCGDDPNVACAEPMPMPGRTPATDGGGE